MGKKQNEKNAINRNGDRTPAKYLNFLTFLKRFLLFYREKISSPILATNGPLSEQREKRKKMPATFEDIGENAFWAIITKDSKRLRRS